MTSAFRLPTNKQRLLTVGRTGSGKTQFGAWALSKAPFDVQPYIIVDYKGDELLASIERARPIGYKDKITHPGLYYLRAMPGSDEAMEAFLWNVWRRERTGLFFDEGYMVPNGPALQALLTQGRSKRIPIIMLSQRPVWLSRFAFSEADFYAVFHLNDERDVKTVAGFTSQSVRAHSEPIPEFSARWYDVGQNASFIIKPVPDAETILEDFHSRLKPKRRVI